jgi:drug/metabolite transporter (DMT)-like permease
VYKKFQRFRWRKNINTIDLPSEKIGLKTLLWLLLLTFLWGGNFVATKISLDYMQPFMLAGVRFAIGALFIAIWGLFAKAELKPQKSEIFPLLIMAILFSAQICTFNLGIKYTLAGRSSILMSMNPIFVAIFAHFFIPNDRLNLKKISGLILAFLGMIVVFRDNIGVDRSQVIGDIIIISSALIVSVMTVYTKKLVQNINLYKLLLWQMVIGLIPFFGLSFALEDFSQDSVNFDLILSIFYQSVIVAGFSFILWTLLLKRHSASKLSVFIFTMPIFGVGLSALMLHDQITPYLIIGTALVASGIYIVNKG